MTRLEPAGLTPLQIEFCHMMAHGPNAGNGTKCVADAGYKPGEKGTAAAMATELLGRDDIRAYLGLLYAERRAGRIVQARPWERLLPAAQALQLEVIQLARDAAAAMRGQREATSLDESEEGEAGELVEVEVGAGLVPVAVTGPMVNLVRAGLEAAELVEAYAVGRPVTRTEQGAPGQFKEAGLRETVNEIRESMGLLQAAGALGLLGLPSSQLSEALQAETATKGSRSKEEVEVEAEGKGVQARVQDGGE